MRLYKDENPMSKEQALEFFRQQAAKQGKTLEQFINEDIREMLESAWHIQKITGLPVKIDDLTAVLNGEKSILKREKNELDK